MWSGEGRRGRRGKVRETKRCTDAPSAQQPEAEVEKAHPQQSSPQREDPRSGRKKSASGEAKASTANTTLNFFVIQRLRCLKLLMFSLFLFILSGAARREAHWRFGVHDAAMTHRRKWNTGRTNGEERRRKGKEKERRNGKTDAGRVPSRMNEKRINKHGKEHSARNDQLKKKNKVLTEGLRKRGERGGARSCTKKKNNAIASHLHVSQQRSFRWGPQPAYPSPPSACAASSFCHSG